MRKRSEVVTDEMLEALEAEIVGALIERLPELRPYAVKPEVVEYFDRRERLECWVVARGGDAAMVISVQPEKFGVGFLGAGGELDDVTFYPTPEIAVPAFLAAKDA